MNSCGPSVEKVVKLIEEMLKRLEADEVTEQRIYDKFACWCETTSTRKANDIVQAQADLRSLGQRILKLKGKVATRAAEIKELADKIESNQQEQDEATAVRQKRNGKFMARQEDRRQWREDTQGEGQEARKRLQ